METVTLWQGDCLELMKNIPDGSVDLVLTDPPYGTMGGESRSGRLREHNRIDDICKWDKSIDEKTLLTELLRVTRQNGKIALFSQEPYTSKLILANIPRLDFVQRLAWKKNVAGNFLCSTQNCMQYIEDIVLFRKDSNDHSCNHPLRQYFLDERRKTGLTGKAITDLLGNGMGSHYFTNGIQFSCPTRKNYEKLQSTGCFPIPYEEIKRIDEEYCSRFPNVFNLNGYRSKSNVFEYAKDSDGYHPTQKPVALLEDIIRTYTNEGETVLDNTMGSGSTGVACVNTNRNFIGIELDNGYFGIAKERIEKSIRERD